MSKSSVPSASALKHLLRFYQRILRLQDWNIAISYCKAGALMSPTARAENQYDLAHKESMIRILHPDEIGGTWDVELSLVHELLHLHITPAILAAVGDADEVRRRLNQGSVDEETAIALIADGMVKLRRAAA